MKLSLARLTLLLLCVVAVFAEDSKGKFTPLNVKPGLWEKTVTYKMSGAPPIPTAMLDKLTPEQRARFEERMKASSAGNSRTQTDKDCITKEQLQDPIGNNDKRCTWTIQESTPTKAKGKVACEEQGVKMSGNGEFSAPDQEHMNGSMHIASSGGGNSMTVDSTFSFKWLSASCK